MNESTPGYYAVIPASVRYDDKIPANAKLLYGEISSLIGSEGYCYASNAYFASLYGLSERTISGLISALQSHNYLVVSVERDQSGKVINRKLFIQASIIDGQPVENNFYTQRKSFQEGIEENFQYTNLSNTNIDKEIKKEKSSSRGRKPKEDIDPLPLFIAWIKETLSEDWPRDDLNGLYAALERFCKNRIALKKPMKTKTAVTALCNRLMRLSDCNVPTMIDMLDTSTCNGWQSVFPPKGSSSGGGNQQKRTGRVYEEL